MPFGFGDVTVPGGAMKTPSVVVVLVAVIEPSWRKLTQYGVEPMLPKSNQTNLLPEEVNAIPGPLSGKTRRLLGPSGKNPSHQYISSSLMPGRDGCVFIPANLSKTSGTVPGGTREKDCSLTLNIFHT